MASIFDTYARNSKGWDRDFIAIVHPRIYLGSALNVNFPTFNRYNITHAINCATPEHDSPWFKKMSPNNYRTIGAQDTLDYNILNDYPKFEQYMDEFLANPNCKNIYVHCQCGINRSAFLLLIYLCRKFGYQLESTVKNILIQRPCCFRNPSFRTQVVEYIKKLD